MSGLVLYDDARARTFEPFALTRPVAELRAGAEVIRRRWEGVTGRRATGFAGAPHLSCFVELDAPPAATGMLAAGTIVANARCAPALGATLGDAASWRCDGRVAAVRLSKATDAAALADGAPSLDSLAAKGGGALDGWWLEEVWDLVRHLPAMLTADAGWLAARHAGPPPVHVSVLGEHPLAVARGAYIEPFVLADTTAGAVVVLEGARVAAFTRLAGPCVIGAHAQVGSGRIAGSSIGEHARVHGELSVSIILGHSNKAHDGFVGHSVLGRWVNLGAGTVTSNLKNNYGPVALWTPSGVRTTGLQFLGSLVGDHAKTAIGTRLTTGCVIGAGANVFGDRQPPKFVPPFAWGDHEPFETFALDKFLEVAERVMKRREVALSDGMRDGLAAAWRASQR